MTRCARNSTPARFKIVKVKGGHHFDGDYAALADDILAAAKS